MADEDVVQMDEQVDPVKAEQEQQGVQKPDEDPDPIKTRKVKIGGKEFEMEEGLAEALEAEQKASQERSRIDKDKLKQEILESIGGSQQPDQRQQDDDSDDLDTEFFTHPSKAIREQFASFKSDIVKELRGEYQRDQAQREFWDSFYMENKDLKPHAEIVDLVFRRDLNELSAMSVPEAKAELAKRVSKKLLDIANQTGVKGGQSERTRVEGASGESRPKPKTDKSEKPKTLSDHLKARRQQLRQGVSGG